MDAADDEDALVAPGTGRSQTTMSRPSTDVPITFVFQPAGSGGGGMSDGGRMSRMDPRTSVVTVVGVGGGIVVEVDVVVVVVDVDVVVVLDVVVLDVVVLDVVVLDAADVVVAVPRVVVDVVDGAEGADGVEDEHAATATATATAATMPLRPRTRPRSRRTTAVSQVRSRRGRVPGGQRTGVVADAAWVDDRTTSSGSNT